MRKLRNHKGVKYLQSDGCFKYEGMTYKLAANVITNLPFLTDDDHIPLMDIKKNPHEPAVTLEQVVHAWHNETQSRKFMDGRIHTTDIAELCSRLRNAFPNIDEEST